MKSQKFTKKHYTILAKLLNDTINEKKDIGAFIAKLSIEFEKDNPNFKSDTFINKCFIIST